MRPCLEYGRTFSKILVGCRKAFRSHRRHDKCNRQGKRPHCLPIEKPSLGINSTSQSYAWVFSCAHYSSKRTFLWSPRTFQVSNPECSPYSHGSFFYRFGFYTPHVHNSDLVRWAVCLTLPNVFAETVFQMGRL